MDHRKVLIFGQPFNKSHGGGITLTNLFKGWPKDKIAVADSGHMMHNVTTEVCDTYYQLGSEEYTWLFPFNFIQKKYTSGIKSFVKKNERSTARNKSSLRYSLVNKVFYPVLQWFGLFNCLIKIKMSSQFRNWLSEFKPDLLYAQVTTRESLIFVTKLIDYLKIPVAIHFMDDWPSTIGGTGLLKNFWRKKIDSELRILLDKVDLFLSISDAMSSEYRKRYGKEFIPFHNPIDANKFLGLGKRDFADNNILRILYLGRIGMANKESLTVFAKAVSKWDRDSPGIYFDIFTPDLDSPDSSMIKTLKNIRMSPPVNHEEIPNLMTDCDLLLLPLDFTKTGLTYAQYSIPTKASEYMMSGTPILVFAPEEAAISKFCSENDCAYCLTSPDINEIYQAIDFIIRREDFRDKWTRNARGLASKLFDASIVRENFQTILSGLADKQRV